jgi:tRNA(Ile)-lysidine synthase
VNENMDENKNILHIENKIGRVIVKWNMLPKSCTVVVGLSGGADSMALTHFLLKYAQANHIHIVAAHINHGLRGEEADRDEHFVAEWCEKNGVELKVLHTDIRARAAERSQGLEECGRSVRYEFFRNLCPQNGKIATAHTLSDSAETVLFNLTAGAGTRGLRGIAPVRGNIIRPLIGITRAEVEAYCKFYGLSYVTDSSNLTDHYARNKIRHSVIPVLKEINPAFEANVLSMTEHLREDEAFFEEKARAGLAAAKCRGGYRLSKLNAMPRPVLMRAIAIAAGEVAKARLESRHLFAVEEIIRRSGGSVTVAGGIQFTVQGNTVFITKNEPDAQWSIPLNPDGTILPDGRVLKVKKLCRKEYEERCEIHNLLFNNLINYDTILNITSVRNRRSGDSFRPVGRGVTKSLKKLFNEAKLEPMLRSKAVMLERGGTILWIEGFGASQDACVTNNTQNIAEIIIKEC